MNTVLRIFPGSGVLERLQKRSTEEGVGPALPGQSSTLLCTSLCCRSNFSGGETKAQRHFLESDIFCFSPEKSFSVFVVHLPQHGSHIITSTSIAYSSPFLG